ncbi:MAG: TetR/AcrR family transcriptional regulator [Deltaproteobacteria bacterium]|nr:TetR/AcrR family transcriptional regulator [Deltaproteobacteria bacterium]
MTERKTQKARSHARIVRHAARLFREHGVGSVGVDQLMSAAGLTHGAFYAHFRDKNALVAEALASAFAQSRRNLFDSFPDERGARWLELATDRYLAPDHVESAGSGCAVPALAAELARATPALRHAFTEQIAGIISLAEERIGGADARARALSTMAAWVGAISVARAVDDPAFAAEILAAVRATIAGQPATPVPDAAPARPPRRGSAPRGDRPRPRSAARRR